MEKLNIQTYKKLNVGKEFFALFDKICYIRAICFGFYEHNGSIYVRYDGRNNVDEGEFLAFDKLEFITKKQFDKQFLSSHSNYLIK